MLGGGLRFTAAAPAADLLLKPLLRKPLLAAGVQSPHASSHVQHRRPKKQDERHGKGQGCACQGLKHGLIGMDCFRHLSLLSSESEAAASPLVGLSTQFLTTPKCRCVASNFVLRCHVLAGAWLQATSN